ncbi:MAG: Acetyl-CoA synthetase, partial [Berkelbacteria bacterium GW2011_GWA2_38_9]
MTQKIIKKNLKELGFEPNLLNYEKSYRAANWKQVEKEIEWFDKDHLNAAYNAVDKHLKTWRKNKVAMYYEDDFGVREQYSFMQIAEESNKIANVLKNHGIKKEERVFIFLPRVPLLYISFLGILKTGAIAGTLFQAFGEAGLYDRLSNSDARFLITTVEMSERLTNIRRKLPKLEKIFLIDTSGKFVCKGFVDLKKEMSKAST